jgi:hypothetical protein
MAAERSGRHADFSSPRGYYLDYSGWARRPGPTDDHGLPVVRLRDGERGLSPAMIARTALGILEGYLESGASASREAFESLTRWLVENMEIVPGSFGGWSMPEVPPGLEGSLAQGWFSASAHAECVCALIRSAMLFGNAQSEAAARRAFGGFRTAVEDGGFLRELGEAGEEGGLASLAFIEEYPVVEVSCMPLASHMKGLWAIFDFTQALGDASARKLFERCVAGLVFVLDRFDTGYWTTSDLDPRRRATRPASRDRHETHVVMIETLARMTSDPEVHRAAARWRCYLSDSRSGARALLERAKSAVMNVGVSAVPE